MVRGDVHAIALAGRRGRVQSGRRYAVVVQADEFLALSTVVICPTSTSAPTSSFHPEVDLNETTTRVLCEMIGAVDGRALGDRVAHLALDEIEAVDEALELVLALG